MYLTQGLLLYIYCSIASLFTTTTNLFNGSLRRSSCVSRHQISRIYTPSTVPTFIITITMSLFTSYHFTHNIVRIMIANARF